MLLLHKLHHSQNCLSPAKIGYANAETSTVTSNKQQTRLPELQRNTVSCSSRDCAMCHHLRRVPDYDAAQTVVRHSYVAHQSQCQENQAHRLELSLMSHVGQCRAHMLQHGYRNEARFAPVACQEPATANC